MRVCTVSVPPCDAECAETTRDRPAESDKAPWARRRRPRRSVQDPGRRGCVRWSRPSGGRTRASPLPTRLPWDRSAPRHCARRGIRRASGRASWVASRSFRAGAPAGDRRAGGGAEGDRVGHQGAPITLRPRQVRDAARCAGPVRPSNARSTRSADGHGPGRDEFTSRSASARPLSEMRNPRKL